jgi:histidine ammonia-lyase
MYKIVREIVPYLDHDETLTPYIEAVADLLHSDKLLTAVPDDNSTFDW